MIPPILLWLASLAVRAIVSVTRPSSATCPPRWWLGEGVRRSGEYTCRLDTDRTEWPPIDGRPAAELRGRIYCAAGEQPLVINERHVACRRGGEV
jgi:hypothetical protein